MNDAQARKRVVATYGRLMRKLESSRKATFFSGSMRDVSGAYISESVHQELVALLGSSLYLDAVDDSIRMLLAYEYWRAGRATEALAEYESIVKNGRIQAVVASRMIESINEANP